MKLLESKLYINDINKALSSIDLRNLEEKTIFITGGLGLICSTIIDLIINYNKNIKIYIGGLDEKKFEKRYNNYSNVRFIKYDALNINNILNIKPNYIIHGASIANPELYINKPVETILSNFDGVHFLLEFSKKNNVEKLLYISSSEIYGNENCEKFYGEKDYGVIDIDNIRSSYSIAKKASEMLCNAYYMEYGVNTLIVRPGHIFGPSANRDDKRISSQFAYKAALGEDIELKSTGLQKRSYCYSIDCALQILMVLLNGVPGQAYNVGHEEATTIKKMAELYSRTGNVKLKTKSSTEEELKTFNSMNNSSLDISKVKKLGYKNIFTVEEGLVHTVEILKELTKEQNGGEKIEKS